MAWQVFSFMPNSIKCQRCLRTFVNYVSGLYTYERQCFVAEKDGRVLFGPEGVKPLPYGGKKYSAETEGCVLFLT